MNNNYIDEHLDEVRAEFKLLDHWVYLNAADQMVPGNYWLSAVRDFYNFVEFGRMEDIPAADIATHPFLLAKWDESIRRSAQFINADKDEVTNAYRPAITANLILYNMMEWAQGDNVVITDLSYPSIPYILQDLRRRYGIEIRVVRNVNGEILMEDMEKLVDGNTRMVIVDRTTAFCGFTFDMKEVSRIAHAQGALVLDDAMQTLGALDIDVKDDDVDFLVSGAYKWQCGPEGCGHLLHQTFRHGPDRCALPQLHLGGHPRFHPVRGQGPRYPGKLGLSPREQRQPVFPGYDHRSFPVRLGGHVEVLREDRHQKRRGTGAPPGHLYHRQATGNRLQGNLPRGPEQTPRSPGISYTTGDYDKDTAFFRRCAAPGRCHETDQDLHAHPGWYRQPAHQPAHFFNTEEEIDYLIDLQKQMM